MGTDAQGDYVGENKIKFKSRGYMALTYLIHQTYQREQRTALMKK
jgi:hypothetical protein